MPVIAFTVLFALVGFGATASAAKNYGRVAGFALHSRGELDCNGDSPAQKSLAKMYCTDIRGFLGIDNQNTWGGKFYDNTNYIGHDEPDATYLSSAPGSGNNVSWNLKLGKDPAAVPTGTNPAHDVSHWFELSPAPWLSMDMCDANSYPQLPCTPESDSNAPACSNGNNCNPRSYPGGGSRSWRCSSIRRATLPGSTRRAAMPRIGARRSRSTVLSAPRRFAQCNVNCEEPVNFAFIQRDGVPAGPPAPQNGTVASFVPNKETLLMNQGDHVAVHMSDAPAPGADRRSKCVSKTRRPDRRLDAGLGRNGFENTSIVDCSGTPFNFEPEYSPPRRGTSPPGRPWRPTSAPSSRPDTSSRACGCPIS